MIVGNKVIKLENILIVEDDESHAFLAKYVIKSEFGDADIVHVWDGEEALDYLLKLKNEGKDDSMPDVILLDINMPKINGFEFLEKVFSDESLSQLVVFILSSSGLQQDINDAHEKGASGFLIKPLEKGQLTHAIQELGYEIG